MKTNVNLFCHSVKTLNLINSPYYAMEFPIIAFYIFYFFFLISIFHSFSSILLVEYSKADHSFTLNITYFYSTVYIHITHYLFTDILLNYRYPTHCCCVKQFFIFTYIRLHYPFSVKNTEVHKERIYQLHEY